VVPLNRAPENWPPENWPLQAPPPQDLRWLRVEDASAVAACRNAALALADRLQFPAARADQLALAVTEAASNLHKHASEGSLWLGVNRDGDPPGIDLVTIDAGPGLADVNAVLRDGHSTAGTLGIGLGAIRRLADFCDLYSRPGRGTALAARFRPVLAGGATLPTGGTTPPYPPDHGGAARPPIPPGGGADRPSRARWAGLIRPIVGETECGDAYGAVQLGDTVTAVMCDGLGHGPLAAAASAAGVAAFLEDPSGDPATLLGRMHRRMAGTRGGAVGVVQLGGGTARFSGLGNIAASVLGQGRRKSMVSIPGIAGLQARTIRQFEHELSPGAAVILHSDGISARWEAAALPGLETRDPLLIAAVLLGEAGIHRDDAGILVLKP
jgi:anti-sigma regulatory factor (Ser/Thr protein kinase)